MSFAIMRAAVAEAYGLTPDQIMVKRRLHRITRPRHTLMRMAREGLGWSFPRIGQHLGGMHYSTVMFGCQAAERRWCLKDQEAVRLYCQMKQGAA